jgi:hypothetical protein
VSTFIYLLIFFGLSIGISVYDTERARRDTKCLQQGYVGKCSQKSLKTSRAQKKSDTKQVNPSDSVSDMQTTGEPSTPNTTKGNLSPALFRYNLPIFISLFMVFWVSIGPSAYDTHPAHHDTKCSQQNYGNKCSQQTRKRGRPRKEATSRQVQPSNSLNNMQTAGEPSTPATTEGSFSSTFIRCNI